MVPLSLEHMSMPAKCLCATLQLAGLGVTSPTHSPSLVQSAHAWVRSLQAMMPPTVIEPPTTRELSLPLYCAAVGPNPR